MPSSNRTALALLAVAAPVLAQGTPDGRPTAVDKAMAPAGSGVTDRPAPYDQVGYASVGPDGAPAVAHATLSPGSYAEITAIESGRTVLVAVTATAAPKPGREIEISPLVAQELGLVPGRSAPVRVRAAVATGEDLAALRSGRAAVGRADAPPSLLTALRRQLSGMPPPGPATLVPVVPPTRSASPRSPASAPVPAHHANSGYYVQIAALSDPARATSIARAVGGQVSSAGRLHRVRLGPFADQRAAQAARDAMAGRGYGDARIVRD